MALNRLFYGDNLGVLRRDIASESVDLIYLGPPFNSNRSYSLLFKERSGEAAQAQLEAFDDTWTWSHETDAQYLDLLNGSAPNKAKDALEADAPTLGRQRRAGLPRDDDGAAHRTSPCPQADRESVPPL
ncbi:MAG: hypothetical protein WKF82_00080 [Nocardioidaceae bacterium]